MVRGFQRVRLGLRGAQVPRGPQPGRAAEVQAGQAVRTRRASGRTNCKCVSNSRARELHQPGRGRRRARSGEGTRSPWALSERMCEVLATFWPQR